MFIGIILYIVLGVIVCALAIRFSKNKLEAEKFIFDNGWVSVWIVLLYPIALFFGALIWVFLKISGVKLNG